MQSHSQMLMKSTRRDVPLTKNIQLLNNACIGSITCNNIQGEKTFILQSTQILVLEQILNYLTLHLKKIIFFAATGPMNPKILSLMMYLGT